MPVIRVRPDTYKKLLQMQGLYQEQHSERVTFDMIIRTFIENQPKLQIQYRLRTER